MLAAGARIQYRFTTDRASTRGCILQARLFICFESGSYFTRAMSAFQGLYASHASSTLGARIDWIPLPARFAPVVESGYFILWQTTTFHAGL
jgi:hypothetical protein